MPLLNDEQVAGLLEQARGPRVHGCSSCGRPVWDYCRTCDEFYWIHAAGCKFGDRGRHDGHRTYLTPYVESRG